MKQIYAVLILMPILSSGISSAFAATPHWVKLGSFSNSTYKMNTVIDSKADYPSNISYELLQNIQNPTSQVKTISRSVAIHCDTGQYEVLGASLWDKDDNYIGRDSKKLLLQKEMTLLPNPIAQRIKQTICGK